MPAAPNIGTDLLADGAPVLCDLDGVVWLSHQPIPGAVESVGLLRERGHRVVFVTNNSSPTVAEHEAALAAVGIPAVGDVLSSSMAAALLVEPGQRAFVCGNHGIVESLERRGVEVVAEGPADVVVVGFHRTFNYESMRVASQLVRDGALLVGTNDDVTYPTPDGLIPGGGAILAAIAAASMVAPVVAGKPYAPMARLVAEELGLDAAGLGAAVMIGDRLDTDGRFAAALGCRFALVFSGVTAATDDLDAMVPRPDVAGSSMATVVARLLGAGGQPA